MVKDELMDLWAVHLIIKHLLLAHLDGYADYYKGFEDNAKAWYRKATKEVPFINHTIINPQMDRSKSLHENKDVFVRAVEEKR